MTTRCDRRSPGARFHLARQKTPTDTRYHPHHLSLVHFAPVIYFRTGSYCKSKISLSFYFSSLHFKIFRTFYVMRYMNRCCVFDILINCLVYCGQSYQNLVFAIVYCGV